MSEYQYYEFQAIDRALTQEEQDSVARLSSRVKLSPYHAVFTYSYGDFRGDPQQLLARCFDAHLYLANWGSRRLYFRFPHKLVSVGTLSPYCIGDYITASRKGEYVVLSIELDEEGGDWVEAEGELSVMSALRQHIIEGDYRALYLVWLKAAQLIDEDEADDGQSTPPLPAGLRKLSSAHQALIAFFDIDTDLIAVAAKASADAAPAPDLARWLTSLTDVERLDYLRQLLQGDASVATLLRSRLKEIAAQQQPSAKSKKPSPSPRLSDLLRSAAQLADERAETKRLAQEAERLRRIELILAREPQLWAQVATLIALKKTKAYDDAVALLKSLQELAQHRAQLADFTARVRDIQQGYIGLSGLRSRLERAGLLRS